MPFVSIFVPTGTTFDVKETPDGKPPTDTASLTKMTENRDAWKAYSESLRAKWQTEADKDKSEEVGKDALAVPLPPVV